MSETQEIEALRTAYRSAISAEAKINNEIDRERHKRLREATAEINAALDAQYGEEKLRREAEAARARRALEDAKITEATAKLESLPKRFFEKKTSGRAWERRPAKPTGREAIPEVRRHDTIFPGNRTWNLPEVGEIFLRVLKKDGTPSSLIERYPEWKGWDEWFPVEAKE